jgi:hypothetical protein
MFGLNEGDRALHILGLVVPHLDRQQQQVRLRKPERRTYLVHYYSVSQNIFFILNKMVFGCT